jgi:prepilin-type N-terminal cleavage/methylation domain-containing protein
MKADRRLGFHAQSHTGFTLIELLVVIAIVAIVAVVVALTLNPAELLRQSRDASRASDIATMTSALNLYTTDQTGVFSFSLGVASDTYLSIYDPSASSTSGDQCQGLGLPSLSTSTGQQWQCAASTTPRNTNGSGWLPVNFTQISAGSPIGAIPVDPVNQTSTQLFYSYNTNGNQFEVTANLESNKYRMQYGNAPQTPDFPDVISGGTPTVSALYNPSGLIGYWPLNEGSGSSTIDASGNGNAGTWSGGTTNGSYYTSGIIGSYAGNFNGNDYITLTNAITAPSFSAAFWMQDTSPDANYGRVLDDGITETPKTWGFFGQETGCGNGQGIGFQVSSHTLCYNWGDSGWHFVVGTFNASTSAMFFYVDSTLVSSSTTSFTPQSYIPIFGKGVGANNYYQGHLDDVHIYNRALSPAEVMALYNATR